MTSVPAAILVEALSVITAQKASIDGNRTIQQMRMATICLGLIHQGQIGSLIILEGDYLIL